MSVYLMCPGGRDRRRVCADVMETLADELYPSLPGFGTEEQQRALAQLAHEDYATLVQHELDAEIERDGIAVVILDERVIAHIPGDGWRIDGKLIDDLSTAVRIVLEERHSQ